MSILKNSIVAAAIALVPGLALADQSAVSWAPPSGNSGEIAGSQAILVTSADGASMRLITSGLTPGHVVSAWFIAIQSPENCSTRPCPPPDPMGRSAEVNSVAALADSAIVDDNGGVTLSAFMPVGAVEDNFFDTVLTTPQTAEFHLVINDHGPLIHAATADMLTSYRGGCTDESIPPYYPAIAASFGQAGPNTCRTVQVAIFAQDDMVSN